MAEKTAISWCDATFNPWMGCTRVSPACDDCYAARSTPARAMGIAWGAGEPRRRTAESTWDAPKRWSKALPGKLGRRPRVFCASLADVFDNEVPRAWRVDLLRLIEATPELDWLLLTKRVGNVNRMLDEAAELMPEVLKWPLSNVWLGATVVNQEEADRDVPKLLAVPARVRFLSIEPMIGPIDLTSIRVPLAGESYTEGNVLVHKSGLDRGAPRPAIDWVICGGESGPHARPMHPAWVRSLRDQCAAAGVPFHFKQHGEWCEWGAGRPGLWMHPDGRTCSDQDTAARAGGVWTGMFRAGKAAAGRLLDGVEHNGFPR